MNLRVLIVAEHASAKFGGEAALPLHYYRILCQRGIPTWLVVHERTRSELQALFPETNNIAYVPDTIWHRRLNDLAMRLPRPVAQLTVGFVMRLLTQVLQRRLIRRLVQQELIQVIHQPAPVSPKEPSMIFDMGAPVIFGPMNGGMKYPPAFQQMMSPLVRLTVALGLKLSGWMNQVLPGKRRAALLLVANQRTRLALPRGACQNVMELVENGVDLSLWDTSDYLPVGTSVTRYVFVGRLIDWKAVDLLLLAFKQASTQVPMSLTLVGDGEERHRLERQAEMLGVLGSEMNQAGQVYFAGWLSQPECSDQLRHSDALVLPSLLECGGAVVLEAMVVGLPVIATHWGGPADYLDDSCGILVEPSERHTFVENLAIAMMDLARSPEKRVAMGKAGRERVRRHFDWEKKVDRMIEVYRQVIANEAQKAQPKARLEGISGGSSSRHR
jgi:glycosyltransferase involved in cell wall biosynthesis